MKDKDHILKKEWKSLLTSWDFEWFCSFNIGSGVATAANTKFKLYCRDLGKTEGLQVAGVSVFVFDEHGPHIHALIFARGNKGKKSLKDVDHKTWEKKWNGDAKIVPVKDEGAAGYVVDQNTPSGRHEWLTPFGTKVLKKYRKTKD